MDTNAAKLETILRVLRNVRMAQKVQQETLDKIEADLDRLKRVTGMWDGANPTPPPTTKWSDEFERVHARISELVDEIPEHIRNSNAALFKLECTRVNFEKTVRCSAMYARYRNWCLDRGKPPASTLTFDEAMRFLHTETIEVEVNGAMQAHWNRIELIQHRYADPERDAEPHSDTIEARFNA